MGQTGNISLKCVSNTRSLKCEFYQIHQKKKTTTTTFLPVESIQILSDLPRSREAKTPGLDLELRSTCVVWIFAILPVARYINVNVSFFKLGYHIYYRLLFVLTRGWLAAVCSHDIASYKVTHVVITLQLAVTSLYFRFSLGDFYATFWHMSQLWKHFHARSCTTGLMHVFWTVWNPWEMFIVSFTMGLFGKVPTNSWTLGWSDLMAWVTWTIYVNTDMCKFYTCVNFFWHEQINPHGVETGWCLSANLVSANLVKHIQCLWSR